MYTSLEKTIEAELQSIRDAGLWKSERIIESQQSAQIRVPQGEVVNFCANNYLGLANHPELIDAGKRALDERGYGMASVRFICGTADIHKTLEAKVSAFLGMEDTILYSSCFDANAGLFETILTAEDAIVSDQLNHASIIDGVRLCKAKRFRYLHNDMADLEVQLKAARDAGVRNIMIATDGVFSMDGHIANLQGVCDLAEQYDAAVMVDDSHATGFFGPGGRGTPAYCGVEDRVDVITSTFGKALGGASGGFTSGKKSLVDLLRNRSRPYLFSNSVAPVVAGATCRVLDMLSSADDLREQLTTNTQYFRRAMTEAGFDIPAGEHPIAPVMLGDANLAADMATDLLAEGIYVIGFSFPVVPKGKARIRVQLSAAHTQEQLQRAVDAFTRVGKKHGVVS